MFRKKHTARTVPDKEEMKAGLLRLTEEMNFRLFCEEEQLFASDSLLWVESITLTDYEMPAKPSFGKEIKQFLKNLGKEFSFIGKKQKSEKKAR